jgi:CheY-like chemotaxis protein
VRLEFCLLVVDDHPDTVEDAIGELSDYLESKGFTLQTMVAPELSENALRDLARNSGKDFNLVMVDYNLGREDLNGAIAAARMRRELQFTDMIFYSSGPSVDLLAELAKQHVAGVFVADRQALGESLRGLAETVIGKAVDLSHLRGIAMAEVADMDVQMEEILEKVFSSADECFRAKAARTLRRLGENAEQHKSNIVSLVEKEAILEIVADPRLFPSMQKYHALMRVVDCLSTKPTEALGVLKSYEADVIVNRNTLAHAKEDRSGGESSLRAIKRGKPSIPIDDAWMADFRGRLRAQRAALSSVCEALGQHLGTARDGQEVKETKP